MRNKNNDSLGKIRIKSEVIYAIVSLCINEIEGIDKLGSAFSNGIKQIFSKKKIHKGIKVEIKEGNVKIYISIIVKAKKSIKKVSEALQSKVKQEVEKTSDLKVQSVDVIVQDLVE